MAQKKKKQEIWMAFLIVAMLIFGAFAIANPFKTLGSFFLPIQGKEYKAGDTIDFQEELQGKITIPPTFGDCGDNTFTKPCWRFPARDILPISMDIIAIEEGRIGYQLRCNDYTPSGYDLSGKPIRGIWGQAYAIPDKCTFSVRSGNLINPITCSDYEYIVSNMVNEDTRDQQCTLLQGTKQGLHCVEWVEDNPTNPTYVYCSQDSLGRTECLTVSGNIDPNDPRLLTPLKPGACKKYDNYQETFKIQSGDPYSGQAPDGWRIFVSPKPASTPDKVQLEIEIFLYTRGEQADSMWILDSCVASKAGMMECGQQTLVEGEERVSEVIDALEDPTSTPEDVLEVIEEPQIDAETALEEAEAVIDATQGDTSQAEELLQDAQEAYESGDYEQAETLAAEAKATASGKLFGYDRNTVLIGGVLIAALVLLVAAWRLRR